MNSYDTRGRLVAQAFYTELEKISSDRVRRIVDVVNQNRDLARRLEPDMAEKLKPGTGSLFFAWLDRKKARKLSTEVENRAVADIKRMRADLMRDLSSASADERLDRMKKLVRLKEAEDEVRYGTSGFKGGWGTSQQPAVAQTPTPQVPEAAVPAPPSTARNIAFGAGLGAAGLLGAQYYLSQPQPQY